MPKGILGWASGAERIERAKSSERRSPLWRKYDHYSPRSAPAPLRSHALVVTLSVTGDFSKQKQDPEYEGRIIIQAAVHFTELGNPKYILFYTAFTFMHLPDAFIQSKLYCI